MGDFIITCFESGTIDYTTANLLILLYDPIYQTELIMADCLLNNELNITKN